MAAGSCYEYSHVASAATSGQPWVQTPRLPGKSSEDIHSLAKTSSEKCSHQASAAVGPKLLVMSPCLTEYCPCQCPL